jgi:plasmid stability protein
MTQIGQRSGFADTPTAVFFRHAHQEYCAKSSAIFASTAIIAGMATLTIRQLDEKTKTRLRIRAAHHGRSMEEEAREILRSALTTSSPAKGNLAEAIHRRFAAFGGIELAPVKRDALRDIPGFEE